MPHLHFRNLISACALALVLGGCTNDFVMSGSSGASDRPAGRGPSLVTSSNPAPDVIYRRGSRDTVLAGADTSAAMHTQPFYSSHVETLVTRKVADLNHDLSALQHTTSAFQDRLNGLQAKSDTDAAQYYEIVATINTELQSGTTAGNPVLVEKWNLARNKLDNLSESASFLNALATDLSNEASKASYLQDNVRAAYGLSGAVKEDHESLRQVEDGVNQQIVYLNRLLTSVNDEISRRSAYLRTENLNMQTLSLAINNGELYGQNITNSLFKKATDANSKVMSAAAPPAMHRPLVIIRFDRPNVNYEEALYNAVSQALEKYPGARFDLVAVSPSKGNPAQMALASSEARKNGEAVMRSLAQMGLPVERIRLNAANSSDVRNSEVHLYLQ
ncbi:MAG: hypothetical protein EPN97_11905 [Alphaproteobacteria bacterium]|nr:MAG: hypothetical protein EPN97_11905 [Alphaproteobacteria bacterium]